MTVHDFLTKHVEGYLFGDLRAMARISLSEGEEYGACGYPMMFAALSGMELLGGLLSSEKFDEDSGYLYFGHYWQNYFVKSSPRYNKENLEGVMRNLVRHGLAHFYLTKPNISIVKGAPQHHLRLDSAGLWFDVVAFMEDFIASYEQGIRPLLVEPAPTAVLSKMQQRLDEIYEQYQSQSDKRLATLPGFLETRTVTGARVSNASTMAPPYSRAFEEEPRNERAA